MHTQARPVEPRRASPPIPAYLSLRVRLPLLISALIAAAAGAMLWGAEREVESTLLRAGGERASSASAQVASLLERTTQAADNVRRAAASPEIIAFLEHPTDDLREQARARLSVLAVAGPRRIALWNAASQPVFEIWVPGVSAAGSDPTRLPAATHPPAAGFNDLQAAPSGVIYADFGAEVRPSRGTTAAPLGMISTRSTLSVTPVNAFSRLVGDDAVIGLGSPTAGAWTDLTRVNVRPAVDLTRVGVAEYRAVDGTQRLGAATTIRGTPWSVWVEFNRAHLLAPARLFLQRMILIALLVVAVGALVVGRLTLRMMRPLHALAYAADEVAAGDLTRRVAATGQNEIGRLGRAFNEMVDGVTFAHRQLETQVVERDRALDALRESEAHYRAIIDVAIDCVIAIDAAGRVLEFNPAAEATFGFRKADVVGRELADFLVPPAFRQAHRDGLARNAAGGGALIGQRIEMPALRADGTEIQIELAISVVPSAGPRTWIAVARDITDRKRAEATRLQNQAIEEQNRRILEANRLKGEFVANMSHELRTPLNAIIGFADLMHTGKAGPVSALHEEYLGDILTSSRHLLQLINDVLDLAKVESGKMEFRPESVDMVALVEDVRNILRGLAGSKRINVDVHVEPVVSGVVVDPMRVKQILYNFLSNAIKFTPDGGRVTVRVAPEGADTFRIDVTDTGVGIRPDDLDRLFVEFEQLDAGIAKEFSGTGLGLALTRRLAEAHGGRVEVLSALGRGSTFSAILPRAATKRALAARTAVSGRVTGNRTVLVVEDDAGALKLAQLMLAGRGYSSVCACNAEEGLRAVVAHAPGLVIVDLLMPGVDGLEFVARLRAMPEGRALPIVVWTVKDVDAEERRRLELLRAEIVMKRGDGAEALVEAMERLLPLAPAAAGGTLGR